MGSSVHETMFDLPFRSAFSDPPPFREYPPFDPDEDRDNPWVPIPERFMAITEDEDRERDEEEAWAWYAEQRAAYYDN